MSASRFIALLVLALAAVPAAPNAADNDCDRGVEAQKEGNNKLAVDLLDSCLRQRGLSGSQVAFYYFKRGRAYNDLGEYDRAIRDFGQAIQYDPDDVNGYNFRGRAYMDKRLYPAAIADFEHAIEIDPGYEDPYNNLAWILATAQDARLRDGERAVELAQEAVKLLPSEPTHHDTLAAAYAEAGRYPEAVETQQQAIAALPAHRRAKHLANMQAHLAAYMAGQPWRE
jgi:tetratricopeptide (TPR) repeat protein